MKKAYINILLLIVASLFVTVFSVSTSPLYEFRDCLDQDLFLLIGKYWAKGCVPYVELWDQKGPLIFLIDAVGFYLCGDRVGVYLIQIAFMWANLILLYKIFRSNKVSVSTTAVYVCVFLVAYLLLYNSGNMLEEYILPLLILSIYSQYKWVQGYITGNKTTHRPLYSILYGFTFSFALFTRLTNALGLCGGVGFIAVLLVFSKSWRNLLGNIGGFILGFAVLALPLCIYFYQNDALYEMWYGTFIFNTEYAKTSVVSGGHSMLDIAFQVCCIFTLLLSAWMIAVSERKLMGIFLLVVSLLPFLWIWNSYGYGHYSIICLPLFVLFVLEIRKMCEKISTNYKRVYKGVLYVFFMAIISITSYCQYNNGQWRYEDCREDVAFFSNILKDIPPSERNSFVSYNIRAFMYLYNDIKPCYPYFSIQDWYCINGQSMESRINTVFSSCKAKWVLAKENLIRESVQNVLDTRYCIHSKNEYKGMVYVLYKRI